VIVLQFSLELRLLGAHQLDPLVQFVRDVLLCTNERTNGNQRTVQHGLTGDASVRHTCSASSRFSKSTFSFSIARSSSPCQHTPNTELAPAT
jgi:hypothetical protein